MKKNIDYIIPKVKVVSFMIEKGFSASLELKGEDDSNSMEEFEEKDYGSTNFFGDPIGS